MNRCMITGCGCEGGEMITLPNNGGAIWVASSTKALLLLGHSVEQIRGMSNDFEEQMKEVEIRISRFKDSKMEIK